MTSPEPGKRPGSAERTGWAEVKEILADFLLVFFGTWLFGRAMLDWLNGMTGFAQLTILMVSWMVLETGMAIGIIALGVDRWRTHSREKSSGPANRPRREEYPETEWQATDRV